MASKQYYSQLSEHFLTPEEQALFEDYLYNIGLNTQIWKVYECLFQASTKYTKPYLLKVYRQSDLVGCAILIRCTRYGKALFKNKLLARSMDFLGIPFYLWIRFGACMDMMSNQGFIKKGENSKEVFAVMIDFLNHNKFLTIVNDYTHNKSNYPSASVLPALPQALINTSGMGSINDYLDSFKNIKRKLRVFKNKGGEYYLKENRLDSNQLDALKKCFLSTAEKSIFYLPYQDLYLNSALVTSSTKIDKVQYFIATLKGEFIGYQAAIETGQYLNALHGAFDRERKSNYHAYDILFVKMTEYAISKGLKMIDLGAVLNITKQKMVNETIDMSYFVFSRFPIIQKIFKIFLKWTKIQGGEQMKFRN